MPLMERREDTRPWGLILALTLAATAGILSLPLQVLTFRNLDAASKADIDRNAQLVQQVRELEEVGNRDVMEHRVRNEQLHADLCRIVLEVATAAEIAVTPCASPLVDVHPR